MNHVERFDRVMAFEPVDRLPAIEWAGYWDQTLARWQTEGLPTEWGGDASKIREGLGLDPYRQFWIGPWGSDPRKELTAKHIPVQSAADYEALLPLFYPDPPFNAEWLKPVAEKNRAGAIVVWLSLYDFFWWPRTLFGIEGHLLAFYDQPELMHRMNEDLQAFNRRAIEAVCKIVQPSFMTIAEDMSYNHGPMLSKECFDEFLTPYYRRLVPVLKDHGILPLVDTDGMVEPMIPWLEDVGIEGCLPLERMAGVDVARIRRNRPRRRAGAAAARQGVRGRTRNDSQRPAIDTNKTKHRKNPMKVNTMKKHRKNPMKVNTMKLKSRMLGLGLALLAAAGPAFGAAEPAALNLYVAPEGKDAWSGKTPKPGNGDGPLASLAGARDAIRKLRAAGSLKAPIRVIVADGTYRITEPLRLGLEDSGTREAPVSFEAAPGARPLISGGVRITGFQPAAEKGLWQAKIPAVAHGKWYFEQLWVNGQRATRARSPNKFRFYVQDAKEEVLTPGKSGSWKATSARHTLGLRPDDLAALEKVGPEELKDVQCVIYHKWDSTRRFVETIDPKENVITTLGMGMYPWNRITKGGPNELPTTVYFENFRAALDSPGEFFLGRDGLLLYMPRPGEDMATAEVIAPMAEQFVVIEGDAKAGKYVEHISFRGLTFLHGQWLTGPGGFEPAQAAVPIHAVVEANGARHIAVEDCEIGHIGTYGIWFRRGCFDSLVRRCHIHDTGAGGVRIGEPDNNDMLTRQIFPENEPEKTMRIKVDNNIIASGGRIFPCAIGVWIGHASDTEVTHNEIADHYYSGVSVGWVWGYDPSPAKGNIIRFNHVHHIGRAVLSDMGAIYTLGRSEGTVVANNVVHDVCSSTYGGWGLYADEGSTSVLWENNLVYDTKHPAWFMHYGKDNTIRNNVLVSDDGAVNHSGRMDVPVPPDIAKLDTLHVESNILYGKPFSIPPQISVEIRSNCVWNSKGGPVSCGNLSLTDYEVASSGKAAGNLVADPGFVDVAKKDFRLKSDSPALKAGFKPIDYTQAGVYGDKEWVEKGRSAPCPPLEWAPSPISDPVRADFEADPVGSHANLPLRYGKIIEVTDEAAENSKHSLRLGGGTYGWKLEHVDNGVVRTAFSLRIAPDTSIQFECRNSEGSPAFVCFQISGGKLLLEGKPPIELPVAAWIRFEVTSPLGDGATGKWDLSLALPGEKAQQFKDLPCTSKDFRRMGCAVFAVQRDLLYLDNVSIVNERENWRKW